ncbi:MAG: hypothetical protein ACOYXO_03455 [Chloroflexota bacterium]
MRRGRAARLSGPSPCLFPGTGQGVPGCTCLLMGSAAPTGSADQPGGTCTRRWVGLEPTAGRGAAPCKPNHLRLGRLAKGGTPCRIGKVQFRRAGIEPALRHRTA